MMPWWACAVPARGTAGVRPPDRRGAPPPFSVSAYLRRHAGLRGLDRAEGERRTAALVERLGLGALMAERLDDVPGRLAGDLASVAPFTIAVAVVCSLLWRRRE
jgi:hypothetical protein